MPIRRRMCCPGGQRIVFDIVGDAFCYAETHPTRELRDFQVNNHANPP